MTGFFNGSKIYIVSKMYTTLFGYAFLHTFCTNSECFVPYK